MNCARLEVVDDSLVYSRNTVEESEQHNCSERLHFGQDVLAADHAFIRQSMRYNRGADYSSG